MISNKGKTCQVLHIVNRSIAVSFVQEKAYRGQYTRLLELDALKPGDVRRSSGEPGVYVDVSAAKRGTL